MQIDLSPLVHDLVDIAGIGALSVASWALQRLGRKFGVELNAAQRQLVVDVLQRAIAVGAAAAEDLVAKKGWDHPEVKSAIVGFAFEYLGDHGDAALKKAKLDPVADRAAIAEQLTALLPTTLAPIAASPATPNGPTTPAAAPAAAA
jgi:hypothetical protein